MVKPLVLSGRSSRRKLIGASLALALPTALAISGGTFASAARAQPTASPVAPAYNGSAAGGKVIVVLKQQQTGMNLRTQARQRIAAAHADQAPIVTSIRSHGGTGVTQLAAPDAVAATLSAAEVARLRASPAVAEIVPDADDPGLAGAHRGRAAGWPPTSQARIRPSSSPRPGHGISPGTIPPLRTHVIPAELPVHGRCRSPRRWPTSTPPTATRTRRMRRTPSPPGRA